MELSVVIPVYNEEESIQELTEWIEKVCKTDGLTFEIIFVDDGSSDLSWSKITELAGKKQFVKGYRFRRNYGKAAALHTGFSLSTGDVVITMDSDLQDSPDEIPELVKMVRNGGYDLVSGWKKKRYDPFFKRITSRFYNSTARWSSGIKLHDFNCGLKASKSLVRCTDTFPFLQKRLDSEISEKRLLNTGRENSELQNMVSTDSLKGILIFSL
jgi:glycosyltransferase involved in cell wall biosynthesis